MVQPKKRGKNMKRLIGIALIALLTVLTACTATNSNETTSASFDSNEEILSFQALAAASLMTGSEEQLLSEANEIRLLSETEEETDEEDFLTATIEPYIKLVEAYLGSNEGLAVIVEAADREGFDSMMRFEVRGLLGETEKHVIYYNMVLVDEDDDESEFSLEGIMLVENLEYALMGKREVEDGEEEIEFIAKLDDDNYVESKYEVESEETEFEIIVVRNGETVSETKVEIEFDDDETSVELEFLDGESTGKYEFSFENVDGQNILKIEFDVEIAGEQQQGEIVVTVMIDDVTGETYYQLFVDPDDDEAYEKRSDRDFDDDEDEDDDDDEDDEDEEEEEEDEEEDEEEEEEEDEEEEDTDA
jgi:hypothetical protein